MLGGGCCISLNIVRMLIWVTGCLQVEFYLESGIQIS
jgi:hypothetical protein